MPADRRSRPIPAACAAGWTWARAWSAARRSSSSTSPRPAWTPGPGWTCGSSSNLVSDGTTILLTTQYFGGSLQIQLSAQGRGTRPGEGDRPKGRCKQLKSRLGGDRSEPRGPARAVRDTVEGVLAGLGDGPGLRRQVQNRVSVPRPATASDADRLPPSGCGRGVELGADLSVRRPWLDDVFLLVDRSRGRGRGRPAG